MAQVCRRCSRVNPPAALYCYYDGVALDAAHSTPLAIGLQPFAQPFVFPSGRTCKNFDELVRACDDDWAASQEMLQIGFLTNFLDALGRADLAYAARQAAQQRDPERGLEQLLQQLPCTAREAVALLVQPLEVNLGQLIRNAVPRFVLQLRNQGAGMIYGTVTAEADWLTLGEAPGAPNKLFQFHQEFDLEVEVVVKNLRASTKPLEGRLLIDTNAGFALVQVRIELPSQPFPTGVLAGALSPRELAKKAKAAPKEAALLFENGAVRQWYASNGWTYPIPPPGAPGLAGVQQFFEVLGLAKPPRLVAAERSIELTGKPGTTLQHILHLQAVEKKYLFVEARSTTSWLKIGGTKITGQRAQILLRVPSVPQLPGQRLHGFVQLTGNGGQRITVEVHLTVAGTRAKRDEVEVIPAALWDDMPQLAPSEPVEDQLEEVIAIGPLTLEELLNAVEVEPEEEQE